MIQAFSILDRIRPYEEVRQELAEKAEKLMETERLLDRSQRLAALGKLTAGVTHELRNPMGVIRSETEALPDKPRELDYLKSHSQLVLKHIDRMANIINRMLYLSKDQAGGKTNIDLNQLIEETLGFFTLNNILAEKQLEVLPKIEGTLQELQQVYINLIQNALDAMPNGGKLTIRTYAERNDDFTKVISEISDTGKGIPKEDFEKIFDPFFSGRHEGTGLGLSITYKIIREHQERIELESEAGKGTTTNTI